MPSKTYKLLTRDWEDPDGFIHKGEWRNFKLVTITEDKREHCVEEGFEHLLSDKWLWVNYPDFIRKDKTYFIYLNTIDKVLDMDDNEVSLKWDGLNFNVEEKQIAN